MGSASSDRPQRRTAQTGRELDRYKFETETRLAEEGHLKKLVLATLSSGVDARKKSDVKQE